MTDLIKGELLRSNFGRGPYTARVQGFTDFVVYLERWKGGDEKLPHQRVVRWELPLWFLESPACGWIKVRQGGVVSDAGANRNDDRPHGHEMHSKTNGLNARLRHRYASARQQSGCVVNRKEKQMNGAQGTGQFPMTQTQFDATAEIERLKAGIRMYGTHLPDCKMQNFRDESDCTCGWRDLECSVSK